MEKINNRITKPILLMGKEVGYAILEEIPHLNTFLDWLESKTYKIVEMKFHDKYQ